MNFLIFMIMFYVIVLTYFLPSIIALIRKKKNVVAIFLLNLLLGWTILGWVVALIWSVSYSQLDME
jgi:hypothetical protein